MVYMLSLYLILLLLCLPLAIPIGIVALIIHFLNKSKREKQNEAYRQMYYEQNGGADENSEITASETSGEVILPQQPFTNPNISSYQTEYRVPVTPVKPKKQREPLSSSTVMLLIGTALVVLSGIAFGAANWLNTTPFGRVAIILTASIVSFLISFIFGKGVKLKGTSTAFYIVGSLMIPVAVIIAGFYDMLGDWFAVLGGGRFLMYAVCLGSAVLSCLAGSKIYKSKYFIYSSLISASLMFFFLAIQSAFISSKFTAPIFSTVLILMQAAITAALYGFGLHKKTSIEKPLYIIGMISAGFYGFISFTYAVSTASHADILTYFAIAVIIVQLIAYGLIKKRNWMLGAQSLFSILLVWIISANLARSIEDEPAVLLCAFLFTALYFINRFVPQIKNVFSVIVTLIAMFCGCLMTMAICREISLFSALMIPVIFTAVIYAYVFDSRKIVQAAAGIVSPVMPVLIAETVQKYMRLPKAEALEAREYVLYITSAFLLAVTALIFYLPKYAFAFHAKHPRKSDSVIYSGLISVLLLLLISYDSKTTIIIPLVIAALHFILANSMKDNFLTIGSVLSMIITMFSRINTDEVDDKIKLAAWGGIFIVLMTVSKLCYRKSIIRKTNGRTIYDAPLLSSWLILPCIFGAGEYGTFFGLLTSAIYSACFIKKNTKEKDANILLTISAVSTTLALATRPFLVPENQMISNKITFAIVTLLGIAFRVIWRKHEQGAKMSSNLIFVCTFAALMIDALYFEDVGNTVFVLAVTTVILIASFMFRSKTWFSVSSIALVSIVVYSMKDFFASLSGWVYLFAAGLILIGIAAMNEYFKQKGENVKSKLAAAFSDWRW